MFFNAARSILCKPRSGIKINRCRLLSSVATNSTAEKKKGSGVWQVQVVEACPDYKRPKVFIAKKFFPSEESAVAYKKRMIEEQVKIVRQWRKDIKEEDDETVDEEFTEKQLFNGTYNEMKYVDSYMYMPAYSIQVIEVKLEDPTKINEIPSINRGGPFLREDEEE